MICERKDCERHVRKRPMTAHPDGLHACPECGATVYLRDAGYERFTEMPLAFKVRDLSDVVDAIVAEVGLLPLPTRAQLSAKRDCEDAGRGPGCGSSFLPTYPTQKRCDACKGVRWRVSALPEKTCRGCSEAFVPKTALKTRCTSCQRKHREAGKQASYERAKLRRAQHESAA